MTHIIAITGGPKTGKTTLATKMEGLLTSTDDFIDFGWSKQSAYLCECIEMMNKSNKIHVLEGVAVARTLRKFIERNPGKKPCDKLIVLTEPYTDLTTAQEAMAKGHDTILNEILPTLKELGVEVDYR